MPPIKIILLVVVIGLFAVIYGFTPLRDYFSVEGFQKVGAWLEAQGNWAPIVFALIYILATILSLPGSVLTLSGGLIFGTAWGTCLNLISATIGATGAFLIARYLGRAWVQRVLKARLGKMDDKIEQHGFYTVLYLRLVPLFPFNVLNYSLGLTKLRLRDYFWGSLIGMAPGAFVYTSLGSAGRHVDFSDWHTWTDYRVWGPFALVLLLSSVPKLIKRTPESAGRALSFRV